jgi:hypothetical protein
MPGERFLPNRVAVGAKEDTQTQCTPEARVMGIGHYVETTCASATAGASSTTLSDLAYPEALRVLYNTYCGPCPGR